MSDGGSTLQRWFVELRRRKVFRVAGVYLVVAWLLVQVAGTTFEPMGLPGWTLKLVIVLAVLGFPLACAMAWAFDVTSKGIERTAAAAGNDIHDCQRSVCRALDDWRGKAAHDDDVSLLILEPEATG
jgi:hypothetical protein